MSILPLVIGAGINLFSSSKQKKAQEDARAAAEKALNDQRNRAEADYQEAKRRYNSDYYGDYMQRDSIKQMMDRFRETYERQNRVARNRATMSGASEGQVQAALAQNYQNLADTAGSIAAQGDAFRENALKRYEAANERHSNALDQYAQGMASLAVSDAESRGNTWADFATLVNQVSGDASRDLPYGVDSGNGGSGNNGNGRSGKSGSGSTDKNNGSIETKNKTTI